MRPRNSPSIHLAKFQIRYFGGNGAQELPQHGFTFLSFKGWGGGWARREGRKQSIFQQLFDNVYSNSANLSDGEGDLKQPDGLLGMVVPQAQQRLEVMRPLPAPRSAVICCQINSVASQLENPTSKE